jgi:hypothetical protein
MKDMALTNSELLSRIRTCSHGVEGPLGDLQNLCRTCHKEVLLRFAGYLLAAIQADDTINAESYARILDRALRSGRI